MKTYDDWKCTNPEDERLGPEPEPEELNQRDWYHTVWLPNALKALKGEPHDRALLRGTGEEQDDETADSLRGHWGI